eukprot:Seg513.9 transcript_id=Seg513.9/GoldUCD/mRNA.D3Y31 product="hypothetical protein" protein_id=Seg513.9/GoldUCD/D3Y31
MKSREMGQDEGDFEDEAYVLPSLEDNKIGQNCTEYGLKHDKMDSSDEGEISEDDEYVLPSKNSFNGDKSREDFNVYVLKYEKEDSSRNSHCLEKGEHSLPSKQVLPGDKNGDNCYVNVQTSETENNSQNSHCFEKGEHFLPSKQVLPGRNFGGNCNFKVLKCEEKDLPKTRVTNERTLIWEGAEHEVTKEGETKFLTSASSLSDGDIGLDNMGFEVAINTEFSLSNMDQRDTSNNNIQGAYNNDGAISGAKFGGDDQGLNGYVDVDTSAKTSEEYLGLIVDEDIPHINSKQSIQGANNNNGAGSSAKSGGDDRCLNAYVNVDTSAATSEECLELTGDEAIQQLATGNEMEHGIKNNTATAMNFDTKGGKMDHESMVMAERIVERPYDYAVMRDTRKSKKDSTKECGEALKLPNETRGLVDTARAPVDSRGGQLHAGEEQNITSPSDYPELEKEDSNVLLTWVLGKDYQPPLTKNESSYAMVDSQATFVDMKDLEPFVEHSKEDHCPERPPEHPPEHNYQEIDEPNISATDVQLREISSNQNNNNNNNNNELPPLLPRVPCCTNTMKISIFVMLTVLLVAGLVAWVTKISTDNAR